MIEKITENLTNDREKFRKPYKFTVNLQKPLNCQISIYSTLEGQLHLIFKEDSKFDKIKSETLKRQVLHPLLQIKTSVEDFDVRPHSDAFQNLIPRYPSPIFPTITVPKKIN